MQRGRPAPPVELAPLERSELESWIADPRQAPELALRARIVLCCADGASNMNAARTLGVTRETVGKWRKRYLEHRIQGLLDEPRPGAPSTIGEEDVERVRRLMCTEPPGGGTWTTRRMARAANLSQTAISRVWKLFSLEPRANLRLRLPKESLQVERVRYFAGLYIDPPLRAFALCHDPEAPCSLREAADESEPASSVPHRDEPPSLLARLDAHTRKVNGHFHGERESGHFLSFLSQAERALPDGCELHLVLGSFSIAKLPEVESWLRARPSYKLHFIPTSGAWLKLLEMWVGALRRAGTRREREGELTDATLPEFERSVTRYLDGENGIGSPFRWQRIETRAPSRRVTQPAHSNV